MSEEELDELDHAVAAALGGVLDEDGWRFSPPLELYGHPVRFIKTKHSFCREWAYGGPIIERYVIWLEGGSNPILWRARVGDMGSLVYGTTPLVAAMSALVASRRH